MQTSIHKIDTDSLHFTLTSCGASAEKCFFCIVRLSRIPGSVVTSNINRDFFTSSEESSILEETISARLTRAFPGIFISITQNDICCFFIVPINYLYRWCSAQGCSFLDYIQQTNSCRLEQGIFRSHQWLSIISSQSANRIILQPIALYFPEALNPKQIFHRCSRCERWRLSDLDRSNTFRYFIYAGVLW